MGLLKLENKASVIYDLVNSMANNMALIEPKELREVFENKLAVLLNNVYDDIARLSQHQNNAVEITRYFDTEWKCRGIMKEDTDGESN